jgi:hypothetical protein
VKIKADGYSGLNGTIVSCFQDENTDTTYIIQLLDGSRIILDWQSVERL